MVVETAICRTRSARESPVVVAGMPANLRRSEDEASWVKTCERADHERKRKRPMRLRFKKMESGTTWAAKTKVGMFAALSCLINSGQTSYLADAKNLKFREVDLRNRLTARGVSTGRAEMRS